MACTWSPVGLVVTFALLALLVTRGCVTAPLQDGLPGNTNLGSVFNDDGANFLERLWADETTPNQYRKAVDRLLDARPGVLAMCMGLPDPVWYSSKVATTVGE